MARYLLNTNAAIAIALGEPKALEKLAGLAVGDLALSALSHAELTAAAAQGDARLTANVRLLADTIDILAFDQAASSAYGEMMKRLEVKRRRILDRLVAAQALALGAILITTGADDADDIPGLQVEVWRL